MRWAAVLLAVVALSGGASCKRGAAQASGVADAGVQDDAAVAPAATQGMNSAPEAQPSDKPLLGITAFVATVYKEPRDTAKKLGYLRLGTKIARAAEPAGKVGCPGGWYQVYPRGYVCAGPEATTDLDNPILKATRPPNLKTALPYRYAFVRAVLPMYLRVPTAEEQYKAEFKLKEHLDWYKDNELEVSRVILGANDVAIDDRGVPDQSKKLGELGLGKNSLEAGLGAMLGGDGDADPIPFWLEGGKRAVPNVSDFAVPEYAVFADRARRHTGLALVSSFATGADSLNRRFAVTTDLRLAPATKIKPDTGSPWHGLELGGDTPHPGLDDNMTLPLAFVRAQGARGYKIHKGKVEPAGELEHRSAYALTGKMKTVEGVKYYRTKDKLWLHQQDVGLAVAPASWPEAASKGEKWIEVSIGNQTLVLWEGKRPVYATLVSSGKAGLDDPKTTTATIRGSFRIRNKHITATMDSNESSSFGGHADTTARMDSGGGEADDEEHPAGKPAPAKVAASGRDARPAGETSGKPKPTAAAKPKDGASKKSATASKDAKGAAKKDAKVAKSVGAKSASPEAGAAKAKAAPAGSSKPTEEYVPRKGDGLYGVTRRRGEGTFALHDVPYIQYFAQGYALHAAYWHDVFGTPRSHGCINLAPVDAHRIFLWTEPAVPEGWHAINTGEDMGEGTVVIVHE